MKRKVTILLAALMIVSMTATLASCNKSGNETTTGSGNTTSVTTTSATTTTSKAPDNKPTTPEPTSGGIDFPEEFPLVSPDSEYAYKVFSCPYSLSGPGGEYLADQDELEQYMSGYSWEMGAATIPEAAMNDIKTWTDKANGPFGDGSPSGYTNTDIGWTGDNHGLMLYATFTIDNLEEFKNTYEDLYLYMWYDNTPSIYLNGTLIFYKNTNLTGDPKDWTNGDTCKFVEIEEEGDAIQEAAHDMLSLLVEGENNIVIIMKDAWGGRECCFEIGATVEAFYHDPE